MGGGGRSRGNYHFCVLSVKPCSKTAKDTDTYIYLANTFRNTQRTAYRLQQGSFGAFPNPFSFALDGSIIFHCRQMSKFHHPPTPIGEVPRKITWEGRAEWGRKRCLSLTDCISSNYSFLVISTLREKGFIYPSQNKQNCNWGFTIFTAESCLNAIF